MIHSPAVTVTRPPTTYVTEWSGLPQAPPTPTSTPITVSDHPTMLVVTRRRRTPVIQALDRCSKPVTAGGDEHVANLDLQRVRDTG